MANTTPTRKEKNQGSRNYLKKKKQERKINPSFPRYILKLCFQASHTIERESSYTKHMQKNYSSAYKDMWWASPTEACALS